VLSRWAKWFLVLVPLPETLAPFEVHPLSPPY
jgi:hypothetical protein